MSSPLILLLLFAGSALLVLPSERARRKRMLLYWDRACQGARWRRRFPAASRGDIRAFLTLFVGAFAFRRERRLCFSPDDQVLAIYRTLYPPTGPWADSMELETLVRDLQQSYHLDVVPFWREDITLGELFTLTRHPVA